MPDKARSRGEAIFIAPPRDPISTRRLESQSGSLAACAESVCQATGLTALRIIQTEVPAKITASMTSPESEIEGALPSLEMV